MSMTVDESIALAKKLIDMDDIYDIAKALMRLNYKAEQRGASDMADSIQKAWKEARDELYPEGKPQNA